MLKYELEKYKISKLMYNVNLKNKENKSRKMSFESIVKIADPDEDKLEGAVVIQTNASDEYDEIRFNIEIKGLFKFESDNAVNKEEMEEILKTKGFEALYEKLEEIFAQIQSITNQKLPDLPSIEDIGPLKK